MNEEELASLRDTYEELKEQEESINKRLAEIKERVFAIVDLELRMEGQDPEFSSGSLVIGDKKFCKEGGNFSDPKIDVDLFKQNFGEKSAWFITETVSEEVNEQSLEKYLQKHPEDLEKVRKSLIQGKKNPFKFRVRNI